MRQICEYAQVESAEISANGIRYIRSAVIDGVDYHLWELPAEDEFVVCEDYEGQLTFSLGSGDGLTPEQFLVRLYLKSQWEIRLPVK